MQSFDLTQKEKILAQLRNPGTCLDSDSVVNIIYLLCKLRASLNVSVIDPLFTKTACKNERAATYIKKSLHKQPDVDILLMPLVNGHHWSLLVFLPSLKRYIHFDSIQDQHKLYARRVLFLFDNDEFYHKLAYHEEGSSRQYTDWECGYFVLMNCFMMIDMNASSLRDEEQLRLYLSRHTRSIKQENVLRFAKKAQLIVSSL